MEIAALGWLVTFVNTALGGFTDRLKRRPSSERAREYGFDLYRSLDSLSAESRSFVEALCAVSERQPGAVDALRDALAEVSVALKRVERALHQLEPQLKVQVPETAEEVYSARMSRALVVSRAEESLEALAQGDDDTDLPALVADAERAQEEIAVATERVRVFLAEQFSFKESF